MPDLFLFDSLVKLKSLPRSKIKNAPLSGSIVFCREDGIRTHDAVTHILAFQASSFNHSDTSLFGDAKNNKIFEEKKRIYSLLHFATQRSFKNCFKY